MFAARKTWLRMLRQQNCEALRTCEELFRFIPSWYILPLDVAARSVAVYIECQQCVTESIEQQTKSAARLLLGRPFERKSSCATAPADCFERGMDVVIGADAVQEDALQPSRDRAIAA